MDKTDRILKDLIRPEVRTPIATDMFIPNLSGDLSKGNVLETPTQDLDPVNKKYVDGVIVSHSHVLSDGATDVTATATQVNSLVGDGMVDSLHRHSELSASDGTPNPALSVDAAGYVGIGTTSPGALLDVNSAGSATIQQWGYSATAYHGSLYYSQVGDGYMKIKSGGNANTPFYLGVASYDTLLTMLAGYVGIGTTNPATKLHVLNDALASSVRIGGGSVGTYPTLQLYTEAAKFNFIISAQNNINNALEFTPSTVAGGSTFSTPAMVILSSGNVGIGITSPTAKLHLPACAAAANTASLKIAAGTLATTAVSGNIESDGTHLYWTDSGGTRKQLD